MRRRPLVVTLVAALAGGLASGCSGLDTGPAAGSDGLDTPRVLVTLHPVPQPAWKRDALEIAIAHRLYVYKAWFMNSLEVPCIVYGVAPGESMDLVVRRLRADHRVESAQAVQRFELLATGDDPYAHLQHGAATLHAVEAHRWATGRGVRVAVIDTGVDIAHPDLAGRVVRVGDFIERRRRSFTRDIHGTAVAGVLAAVANNGEGISGIAPEAEIFAFRACWPRSERSLEAACDSYSLAQALDVAVTHGAQVVNLSLSGPDDPLLARILRVALERGATVVAALQPARDDLGFPASLAGVIAVAAEGDAALVRPTPGRTVFVAPGSEILAPVPGGGYDFFSGSSMATAQVAGVIALLLERDPTLTARDVAALLAESTGPAPRAAGAALPAAARPGRQDAPAAAPALSGPARVDACRAVARLAGVPETCGGAVVAR